MINFEILRTKPLKFYKQEGFRFFEPFNAVDSEMKPLKVSINHPLEASSPTIVAKSSHDKERSIYDIEFLHGNTLDGGVIVANPKNKGIGEVLNLASIIEFKENAFNKIHVFSLKDAVQFFAKYGFNIVSDNLEEVLHNLKILTKAKDNQFLDKKISARFLRKHIDSGNYKNAADIATTSNNLVSDYIRELARSGKRVDKYDLYDNTSMEFNTLDMIRNKDYLNELLDKHKINYKI